MISEQNKLYTLTDDPPKQEDPSEQVDKDLPQKMYFVRTKKSGIHNGWHTEKNMDGLYNS